MKLKLQQLAGVINDDELFHNEFMRQELYKNPLIGYIDILTTSIKLMNEPLVQIHFKNKVLKDWTRNMLPESFKISKEIDPREEVEGGWKWNGDLTVDDLDWNGNIFSGKPVIEVDGNFRYKKPKADLKNSKRNLKGSPRKVTKDFRCSDNLLTSIEGGPEEVGRNFNCEYNEITSLNGAPQKAGGDLDCYNNKLTSLEGCPETVNGEFRCYNNELTSLEGGPKYVKGDYRCNNNKLTSLEGAPVWIDGDFDAFDNGLSRSTEVATEIGGFLDLG